MTRIIAHLDMDAFFASVEEAVTPSFKGKPIVVGTEPNFGKARGVVSTANYKAREYGIHSALPISVAWQLSEKAKTAGKEPVIFLPVDFELYRKVSENILNIIQKHCQIIEQASIDEFYFYISDAKTTSDWGYAKQLCNQIKKEIFDQEKITCSVGISINKLVSKIAAGVNKPDGMTIVTENEIEDFLNPLSIRELPGIGPKTAEIFYKQNIKTIKDLKKLSEKELLTEFGKQGEKIFYKARGIDQTPLTQSHIAKSIGEQTTFNINSLDALYICENLKILCNNVFERFLQSDFTNFKTITITIRFADFQTKTSSKSFTNKLTKQNSKLFYIEILKLILPFLDKRQNPSLKLIRLIGVRIENF